MRTGGWHQHAIRTALLATAVVAAVLVGVCASIDLLVAHNLVVSADQRLQQRLDDLRQEAGRADLDQHVTADSDRDFEGPVFTWSIAPGGAVTTSSSAPALPTGLHDAGAVRTATIAGTQFRVAGTQVGDSRVVAATSLGPSWHAVRTLLIAEVLVGPLLLAVAFVGALTIGRRVGRPIEAARRRQLAFTADASHELRTPLSVIRAETSLALEGAPDLDAYAEALQHIDSEAGRLGHLVEDLLWLARADAEPAPPTAEPVDIAALATEVADRFGAVAASRGQRLAVETPPGAAAIVIAPPEWIDRLIGVLLDNACRHAPAGGAVLVAVAVERDRVRLSVRDSGPGIPDEEQERIFGRFHRSTEGGGAAGLGLAIGDAIVRQTAGHWQLGRAPEGGASFSVLWSRGLRGTAG